MAGLGLRDGIDRRGITNLIQQRPGWGSSGCKRLGLAVMEYLLANHL